MGALVTRALRPIRSFNIENRAHRVISKEKPDPAPTYPQNIADLKRTLEAVPDIDEKLDKKDPGLDDRLKDVYVTSHGRPEDDITRERQRQSTDRPLPQNRELLEDYELGFKEPERVSYGKTTLRHAIDFIGAHQMNPKEATPSKIALEYKLKEVDVHSVLKYFKTFEVYIPKSKTSPAIFAGPATSRKKLDEHEATNKLESGDSKKVLVNEESVKT
ncbi:protein NDUFAF4 homolog [Ostrinia nubilalis]|uniref:protein NDUFAF4 homolog n=1 Tax=Ostrinia nubilalis TaxID=29057 RepID=UPI0030823523